MEYNEVTRLNLKDFKRGQPEWQRRKLNSPINVYESLSKTRTPLVIPSRRKKKSKVLAAAADIIDFSQKELNAAFEHTVNEYKRKRKEENRKQHHYRIQETQRKKREKIREIESNWNNDLDYQARKVEESREYGRGYMWDKNKDTTSKIYSASLTRNRQRRRAKPYQLLTPLQGLDGDTEFSSSSSVEAKSAPGVTFERISSCAVTFNSFESVLEKEALNSIIMREGLLSELRKYLRPFNFQFHEENMNQVQDIILNLSKVTLTAVENIMKWKNSFVKSRPFIHRNVHEQSCNYLLKMMHDVQFVLSRQNVANWLRTTFRFSTKNSTHTQIIPLFFNPEIDDDQLNERSILYGRFKEALNVLHQEENVYGSLSDQHFLCTWCGVVPETPKHGGQSLVTCTRSGCRNRFCSTCIKVNCGGKAKYHKIRVSKVWVCYICEFNDRQKQIKLKRIRLSKTKKLASMKKATRVQESNSNSIQVSTESEDESVSTNMQQSKETETKGANDFGCASVTMESEGKIPNQENFTKEIKFKSKLEIVNRKSSPNMIQESKRNRNRKSGNTLKSKLNPLTQEQKQKRSEAIISQSHSRKRKGKWNRDKAEGNEKQMDEATSNIDSILPIENEATSTVCNSQPEKEGPESGSVFGMLKKANFERNHEKKRNLAKEWIRVKCNTVSRKIHLAGKASNDYIAFTSLDLHELDTMDADLANSQKVAKLKMLRSSYGGNSHRMTMRLFNQICLVYVKSKETEPTINCNAKGKLKLKGKQIKGYNECISVTVLVPKENLFMGPLIITKAQLGKSCEYLESLLKRIHRVNAQKFLRKKAERAIRDIEHNHRKTEARDYLKLLGRKCKAHLWEKAKAIEVLRQRCNFAQQHCQMQIEAKNFLRHDIVDRYRKHQKEREKIREEFRRMGKRLFHYLKEQEIARLSLQSRANYLKTHHMHQYRTMQDLRELIDKSRSKMDIGSAFQSPF